jgi:anaerobic ribonucleoside-triphosphate reductase activating protein
VDVLVFTGYAPAAARRLGQRLWAAADALVAGPYRPDRPGAEPLRASANQQLLLTTELGRHRFAGFAEGARLQLTAKDGDLYLVGMPAAGDLVRLEERLAKRGVDLAGVTWRS